MTVSKKILITLAGVLLIALAQLDVVDRVGLEHTEEGLKRALVTYGVSRGLNGVISVVQGTEVAVEPVGIGMTFTPGQILDPVNDLIERFSTVVLVAGTAFGIQRVFLEIMSAQAFSLLVGLVTLLALITLWLKNGAQSKTRSFVFKTAMVLLVIRFSVSAIAIFSENFYQVFLAPQFEESSQQLMVTTEKLENLQAESSAPMNSDTSASPNEDKGFLESAKELYRSATQSFDVRQHLEDFKQAAENISENAIKLIVVFVFQTIILPLGAVWMVFQLIRVIVVRWQIGSGEPH